jgi:hypothetical protein
VDEFKCGLIVVLPSGHWAASHTARSHPGQANFITPLLEAVAKIAIRDDMFGLLDQHCLLFDQI